VFNKLTHTTIPAAQVLWHQQMQFDLIHCSDYHIKNSSHVWLKQEAKKAQASDSELKWINSQPIK